MRRGRWSALRPAYFPSPRRKCSSSSPFSTSTSTISPLISASTHVKPDATRTRKLLLHGKEISKLIGKVERAGYTLVPLDLHFVRGRIKIEVGLAKGKKQYDKREDSKARDWARDKARIMKEKA